jgi:CubicO group peptidase (beta-lactamase class C family)
MTVQAWALVENGHVAKAHDARLVAPWWSFTKTVLAAAALALVRDGLIALDEPVRHRPYSLRHLLQHRSGLVNYGLLLAYHEAVERGDDPWPVSTLLERLDGDRLRYPVGAGWEYSNVGYLVVGQVIEVLTGEDLGTALKRLVLRPLGIETARLARERADLDHVSMGSAQDYHPGWVYHGLLVGSVEDAALLLDRLMAGDLLPPALRRDMLTSFALPGPIHGRPWTAPGYGLGLMIGETTGGLMVAGHTGGGPGSTIAVYRDLNKGSNQTAAFFVTSEDQTPTEEGALALLKG